MMVDKYALHEPGGYDFIPLVVGEVILMAANAQTRLRC